MEIRADGVALPYVQYDKLAEIDQGAVIEHKRLAMHCRSRRRCRRSATTGVSRARRRGPIAATEYAATERAPGTKKQREFTRDNLDQPIGQCRQQRVVARAFRHQSSNRSGKAAE